jgi:Acetyltransferase (GNAT) domain
LFIPAILRPVPASNVFDLTNAYGYPCSLWSPAALEDTDFPQQAVAAWVEHLSAVGIVSVFLRFHPLLPQPKVAWQQPGLLLYHGDTVNIDLTLSPAQLWKQTRENHRRQIKQMQQRNDLAVFMDEEWGHFAAFMECYTATMDRVGASPHYYFQPEFFMALRKALAARLHLCVVRIGADVARAGLFTETHGIVQYHLSGSRPAFAHLPTLKLMLHYVRDWAKQRGNQAFHLGGGLGAGSDGVFLFKAGFSPLRYPFYTWRAILNAEAYRALIEERRHAAGVLPAADLKLDGFFPEYRA